VKNTTATRRRDDTAFLHEAVRRRLGRFSAAAGIWALWYAIYRGYYAAGGRALLPGTVRPGSEGQFRLINLAAAIVIGVAAVLPVATLPLWSRRWPRRALLVLCWVVAVGCCMHALVDIVERVLSLAGVVQLEYPSMWMSVDYRSADLQDLFFNEPWFLVEGLLFGALAWTALGPGRPRWWWTATALAATAGLLLLGILTVAGIAGRVIIL
jgi:hypothetical protein